MILDEGDEEAVDNFRWLVAEPSHALFVIAMDDEVLDDDTRFVLMQEKGVVTLEGQEVWAQRVNMGDLDIWKSTLKQSEAGIRLLGDHTDRSGRRSLPLSEAVSLVRNNDDGLHADR